MYRPTTIHVLPEQRDNSCFAQEIVTLAQFKLYFILQKNLSAKELTTGPFGRVVSRQSFTVNVRRLDHFTCWRWGSYFWLLKRLTLSCGNQWWNFRFINFHSLLQLFFKAFQCLIVKKNFILHSYRELPSRK